MQKRKKEQLKTSAIITLILVVLGLCAVMGLQALTNAQKINFNVGTSFQPEFLVKAEIMVNENYVTIYNSSNPSQIDTTYIKSISTDTLSFNSQNLIYSSGNAVIFITNLEASTVLSATANCGANTITHVLNPNTRTEFAVPTGIEDTSNTALLGNLLINISVREAQTAALTLTSEHAFSATYNGQTTSGATTLQVYAVEWDVNNLYIKDSSNKYHKITSLQSAVAGYSLSNFTMDAVTITTSGTSTSDLYATFSQSSQMPQGSFAANSYTVTFNDNLPSGASGAVKSFATKSISFNSNYQLPTYTSMPQKEGCMIEFNGWFTAATGGTQITTSTKMTTAGSHTLYAQWYEIENYITSLEFSETATDDSVTISNNQITVLTGTYYEEFESALNVTAVYSDDTRVPLTKTTDYTISYTKANQGNTNNPTTVCFTTDATNETLTVTLADSANHTATINVVADTWVQGATATPNHTETISGKTYYIITNGEELAYFSTFNGVYLKFQSNVYLNTNYNNFATWETTAPSNVWSTLRPAQSYGSDQLYLEGNNFAVVGLYKNPLLAGTSTMGGTVGCRINNLIIGKGLVLGSGAFANYAEADYFYGCYNYATVIGSTNVGGIVGGSCHQYEGASMFENCHNFGELKLTSTTNRQIGGIAGWAHIGIKTRVENTCTTTGGYALVGSWQTYALGIAPH